MTSYASKSANIMPSVPVSACLLSRKFLHASATAPDTAGTLSRAVPSAIMSHSPPAPLILRKDLAVCIILSQTYIVPKGVDEVSMGIFIDQRIIPPYAPAASMPASRYPRWRSLRMDSMADLLDHVCAVGVGRWLDREKAWLEPLGGAIQIDPLKEDTMIAL